MKKRDTKQLAKKGRNETSQQLLESMAVKNKDLFFYHEKPDSLIVTCRLCGHDHADATDVLSHLKDCVQAFKTDYCSKCFYRAPYFQVFVHSRDCKQQTVYQIHHVPENEKIFLDREPPKSYHFHWFNRMEMGAWQHENLFGPSDNIVHCKGYPLPFQRIHPLDRICGVVSKNMQYMTQQIEYYTLFKLVKFLSEPIERQPYGENFEAIQFRSGQTLVRGVEPLFFKENAKPLIDIQEGTIHFAYMQNKKEFADFTKDDHVNAPPSYLQVQKLSGKTFYERYCVNEEEMETILNSVSGCGSLDSNYDYLSDPTLKKVKDAIRDTQKELFWLPDEKVEALVGQIVARQQLLPFCKLRIMKGADSYKKVLDHIVRCTWRPNKELTEKIDDYEVIIVDVIPDITAALYHSDCDDIPYNGDVLADILASSSFGTFVGLLNKDSHKFEHANFYQLKHVESKDNQFKTKVDLVAKKASERKEIIVDPQHVQIQHSKFPHFLARSQYVAQRNEKALKDEIGKMHFGEVDKDLCAGILGSQGTLFMSIFDSFSPNTIPYWSKRSIGHCLRDNNKARFLEFRQQATAYLFSDTLQGEFADQEFTLDLADKSDKAHNDFMNCMSQPFNVVADYITFTRECSNALKSLK